jgi:hypothetical protein
VPAFSDIYEDDDQCSLQFVIGGLPADEGVDASGHVPNGYFWDGVAAYVAPELVERLEFDSEGACFNVLGTRGDLEQLQARLEPLLASPTRVREVIAAAEADGFEFDD